MRPLNPLQVIMVSSSDWEEDRQRAAALPILDGYVCKPFTADDARAVMGAPAG